ncbi:hypothetical protein Slala05_55380 [Streptomyces lavendulae subsp. lavendulae]|nr:hypothetical protein Slala05_55380 [Streptomyces lavendulae subsp. lavendulae]
MCRATSAIGAPARAVTAGADIDAQTFIVRLLSGDPRRITVGRGPLRAAGPCGPRRGPHGPVPIPARALGRRPGRRRGPLKAKGRFKRLPVVDDDGRLVGGVDCGDLLKIRLHSRVAA